MTIFQWSDLIQIARHADGQGMQEYLPQIPAMISGSQFDFVYGELVLVTLSSRMPVEPYDDLSSAKRNCSLLVPRSLITIMSRFLFLISHS